MNNPFEITMSRRAFMKATLGAAAGAALLPRRAFAAEFTLKLATIGPPFRQQPLGNPLNGRRTEYLA